MICFACDYNEKIKPCEPFEIIDLVTDHSKIIVYACPQCGTLRIERKVDD